MKKKYIILQLLVIATMIANPLFAESKSSSTDKNIIQLTFGTGGNPFGDPYGILPGALSTRVGFFIGSSFLLDMGVDVLRAGSSLQEGKRDKIEASIMATTIHGGFKKYLGTQSKGFVSPYIHASVFTMIPSFSSSDSDDEEEVSEYLDNGSILGLCFSFGAEYFLSNKFSIGGEIGLINSMISYSDSKEDIEVSASVTEIYTGFSLNFNL